MLQVGSWFSKSRRNSNDDTLRPSADYGSTDAESHTKPDPTPRQSSSSSFPNPHDAALADLYGIGPNSNPTQEDTQNKQHLLYLDETLYDPFSGAKMGQLHPQVISDKDAEVKNEELWTGLSRVLDLQSEVATMHMQMERSGAKAGGAKPTARKGQGKGGKWNQKRQRGDTVDEVDEVDGGDEGGDFEDADEEFDDVTADFDDRRKAIDDIMDKLDNLSDALTTFHQLRTPALNLTAMNASVPDKHKPSLIKKTSRYNNPLRPTAIPLGQSYSAPPTSQGVAPGHPQLSINTQMLASAPVVDSPSSVAFDIAR